MNWQTKAAELRLKPGVPEAPGLPAGASEEDWRLYQYLRLGVDREEAENLASREDVDWHRLERLLADGCELDVAMRIFA